MPYTNGELVVPDPGEQVRVLNLLQMYENGALSTKGQRLGVAALLCKTVINIRKLNRKFINQLRERDWRPFVEGSYPNEDEDIVARLHDGHTIITHFRDEDIEEMGIEGVEHWLRLPKFKEGEDE